MFSMSAFCGATKPAYATNFGTIPINAEARASSEMPENLNHTAPSAGDLLKPALPTTPAKGRLQCASVLSRALNLTRPPLHLDRVKSIRER